MTETEHEQQYQEVVAMIQALPLVKREKVAMAIQQLIEWVLKNGEAGQTALAFVSAALGTEATKDVGADT